MERSFAWAAKIQDLLHFVRFFAAISWPAMLRFAAAPLAGPVKRGAGRPAGAWLGPVHERPRGFQHWAHERSMEVRLPYISGNSILNILGVANWVAAAHGMANSKSLARLPNLTGACSNHKASASFALAMASSSVSPAEAQPGNSGNTADQLLTAGSNSTNKRNFMALLTRPFIRRQARLNRIHSLMPPDFNAKTPRRKDAKLKTQDKDTIKG